MISSLYIENIAVIEKTNIEFKNGFNVLTGETGAGKSILINAINAVLGQRTSKDIIRTGAKSAVVIATFENIKEDIKQFLEENGFSIEDDSIILQREIFSNGKNTCRINGRPTTLTMLKDISTNLISVHGQHESYNLMSPEKHLMYIDSFGDTFNDIEEYKKLYVELRKIKNKLNELKIDDAVRQQKIDLLKYQTNEISTADLKTDEEEQLIEQKTIATNKEKITDGLKETYNLLAQSSQANVISLTQESIYNLENIADCLPELKEINDRLNNCFYEIQDLSSEILNLINNSEETEYDLEFINERLDLIYKLYRKYGSSIEEVLEFYSKADKELKILEQYDINMESLKNDYNSLLKKTSVLAKALSDKRQKTALIFSDRVKAEMTYLNMPNVTLAVDFQRTPLTNTGCDKAEFLISANLGETPKPVSKIASGGELSRMMLAIKAVLSNNDDTDTLIFDEIDTGISGSSSQKVGLKLKEVSKNKQVICITHQAQIAALADTHYLIEKKFENNKTFTQINELEFESRTQEIARIIGGVEITQLTLKHAEEMLLATNTKND